MQSALSSSEELQATLQSLKVLILAHSPSQGWGGLYCLSLPRTNPGPLRDYFGPQHRLGLLWACSGQDEQDCPNHI